MARSSHGPRRAMTWAAENRPRPLPRIVRLGRPANDNVRQFGLATRLVLGGVAAATALVALLYLQLI